MATAGDKISLNLPARSRCERPERTLPLGYDVNSKVQIWFDPPLQLQTWTMVPCWPMVPRLASRHLPLATLTNVPPKPSPIHCWLAEPVHVVRTTRLPLRPAPSSRHPVGEFRRSRGCG